MRVLSADRPWTASPPAPQRWRMENNQPLSADQILERIASDKALHDVLEPLLGEVRDLRTEIAELGEVIGRGSASGIGELHPEGHGDR